MAKILIKEFILAFLSVASSVLAFWLWKETLPVINIGILQNYTQFFAPTAALIAAASLFAVSGMLIETAWLLYGASSVSVGAPFFFSTPSSSAGAALAGSVLLAVFAARHIRKEHLYSLGFSASKILKAGLPLFFTVSSLIVSVFYLATVADPQKAASAVIPRPVSDLAIRAFSGPLKEATGLAEIDPELTVDELLKVSVRVKFKTEGVSLSRGTERGLTEVLAHQRDQLAKQYGIELAGDERIGDVLNRAIVDRLREILGPYAEFLPFISALAFFFAFKAFTFPLYFLTILATVLLIKSLTALRIVKSETRQIEVEHLTF